MTFITISTIGFGDVTLNFDTFGWVMLQYVLFLPGLALFAEFTNVGIQKAQRRRVKVCALMCYQ